MYKDSNDLANGEIIVIFRDISKKCERHERETTAAAAALLGFATACENKRTVDMYGTPYFDYKVKGKVTDKEGAPVKGIEVGSQDAGPVTSESDGSYELSGREWSFRQTTLTFTDIDGAENGGEFTEKKVTVEFTEADRRGRARVGTKAPSPARASMRRSKRRNKRPQRLPEQKIRPGRARSDLYCVRLFVYLQNTGCVSAMLKQVWHCTRLSLYLPRWIYSTTISNS